MADIPYGYRIKDGKAVICPQEVCRIKVFFGLYCSGDSIRSAGEKADIQLSQKALAHILQNPVYALDPYYPPLISLEQFEAVQETRRQRQVPIIRNRRHRSHGSVAEHFIFRKEKLPASIAQMSAQKKAALLYACIEACPT